MPLKNKKKNNILYKLYIYIYFLCNSNATVSLKYWLCLDYLHH